MRVLNFVCNYRNHYHNQGQKMRTDPSISGLKSSNNRHRNKTHLSALIARATLHRICVSSASVVWSAYGSHAHVCGTSVCVCGAPSVCVCSHSQDDRFNAIVCCSYIFVCSYVCLLLPVRSRVVF